MSLYVLMSTIVMCNIIVVFNHYHNIIVNIVIVPNIKLLILIIATYNCVHIYMDKTNGGSFTDVLYLRVLVM